MNVRLKNASGNDILDEATSPATSGVEDITASIRQAHDRSRAFGLDPSGQRYDQILGQAELADEKERNRVLCNHASPIVQLLHEQLGDPQTIVVLADANGLVLDALANDDFMRQAARFALCPGAIWSEERQGTNGIGTAIATRRPTAIHGDQHYLSVNHVFSCTSVPIVDPYGAPAGVLDLTTDWRNRHPNTMALTRMSVLTIEDRMFADTFRDAVRVVFHPKPEFVGSLLAGSIAFAHDGVCLSANRHAQSLLDMSLAKLRVHTASSLFGLTCEQLIDHARASANRPLMLRTPNGAIAYAKPLFKRLTQVGGYPSAAPDAGAMAESQADATPVAAPARRRLTLDELDTGDRQVAAIIAKLRRVIDRAIPIVITGETGSGKEFLAQAIHGHSHRRSGPFVALNCASIPETLIESELFGYEEGAFTGAKRKGSAGKLVQADGGTLFLDEIGDMPYALQAKLLRVLQERVVTPLGSNKSIPVDFSVICATHRDLRRMIAQRSFRADLYYRLNGLTVRLPPLRDRSDLAKLIEKMLQSKAARGICRPGLSVAPEVMALFEQFAWPGNFRQLANVLRTAAAMADEEAQIRPEHLPDDFFEDLHDDIRLADGADADSDAASRPVGRLREATTSLIDAALARHDGNVSAAARELGVSRNVIYRQMRRRQSSDQSRQTDL